MTNTEKSIIKTLAYYEALGQYALTAGEIHRYLQKENSQQFQPSFYDIHKSLKESPVLEKYLDVKNGFFFLKGNNNFYERRIYRQKISIAKWRKLKRIIFYLAFTPFLRGLLVSGSLAFSNAGPQSDLDLLVFTEKNRIWTCRTFLSFLSQIIGQRRHDNVIAGKICLNHYITQGYFEVSLQNLSNAHIYQSLIPLTNHPNYKSFREQNGWLKNFLFSRFPSKQNLHSADEKAFLFRTGRMAAGLLEFLLDNPAGDFLEKKLGAWQTKRIRQKTSFRRLDEQELLLSNRALLFHYPICKNKEVTRLYFKKIEQLGLL